MPMLSNSPMSAHHNPAPIPPDEPPARPPEIEPDILSIMQIDQLDLILIEGFKMEDIPKVELHRKSLNKPYLYPNDTNIIAVAEVSDSKVDRPGIESLDLEQPGKIAEFVERFMKQHPGRATVSRIDDEPQLCYASIN